MRVWIVATSFALGFLAGASVVCVIDGQLARSWREDQEEYRAAVGRFYETVANSVGREVAREWGRQAWRGVSLEPARPDTSDATDYDAIVAGLRSHP